MSNENKIRILYVQPGKYPEERFAANELHPLQRLVGGYTHRGDALKASAVLPTMWYRKRELFPAAGPVVRPYIREVVSNRI